MTSLFKPNVAVGAGIGTIALAYTIYNSQVGPVAQAQATDAYDNNLETSRKKAAYMAVAVVAGVSLIAKDPTIFTMGGLAVLGLDWSYRHAIATHPATGQIVATSPQTPTLAAVS